MLQGGDLVGMNLRAVRGRPIVVRQCKHMTYRALPTWCEHVGVGMRQILYGIENSIAYWVRRAWCVVHGACCVRSLGQFHDCTHT